MLPLFGRASTLLLSEGKELQNAAQPEFAVAAAPAAAEVAGPVSLTNAVKMRAINELAIAQHAMIQAKESSVFALASQKEFLAQQTVGAATETYEKVAGLVPEAQAQATEVRKWTFLAAQHRDHARRVEDSYRGIPNEASAEATKATLGWIEADAHRTAEKSAAVDNRADRLAGAVAAAAEPYHLALLRNQKFCEETYSKAKTAFSSSQKLLGDAKKLALKAQELQATGMGLDALQSKGIANGMALQAEELRQWANKLYGQANTACSSAGGYGALEAQAAANAAATLVMNAPMKLPKAL